jgi:hypothetical protein
MRISIGGALEAGSKLVPEAVWRSTFSFRDATEPPIFIVIWAHAGDDKITVKTIGKQRNTDPFRAL